ncbi:DPP IV N-terminal domain-containing protein [Dysgonomonas sp. Marseille-P4677]|uniref:S9 family peptidase n=1 Tax=Dysgonomonas sp. Marseille-P4677 TaxID=2364790 RepID=UPI001913A7F1|nr:S9 family peptidase [Dysgonomonas sp. Marseille-P4677]MBK5721306.1 DPP IV N-terminal domain-containing protein [Dysgonomonas sp. Marseille-P4677]
MKHIFGLLLAALLSITANAQRLDLRDINSGKYYARGVQPVTSSADGESYFQSDKENKMIIKYSYKTGLPTDTIFNVKKARECTFDSFQGFIISPDEKRLLVYNDSESIYRHSFKANYYYYDVRRKLVRKLTENKEKQSIPTFSKDGRMLAYVVNNNIWLSKFDYDTESQVTKDGELGKIINGGTDWVYEEEFGTTKLMDFSADGRLLAFVRFDESNVPQYSMQMYENKLYPTLFSFKYPKAGETNSVVTCNVFDIDSKTIRKMNIPQGMEYIPRIEFLPTGDELAVMTLNRDQNKFDLYYANARSSVCRSVIHEENNRYIDSELFDNIHFFGNQFIYMSEKSGYTHIYLYDNTGVMQKQLTNGNYDVTKLLAVDPVSKIVFYEAAEDSPLQRAIYKVDIVKGLKTKLSVKQGTNNATFSENGKYFINSYSNSTTPRITTVHDATGKELRVLEDNASLRNTLTSLSLAKKEFITVKSADGRDLNAYIMKPADFNASRKYPLVMIQYSGPNSQQVLDSYGMDWTDYLATQGFIVACVDGRGTGARGEEFRKCTYMNLGIYESDDQIAAAKHFATLPYIDGSKIAIWGWSYGGYNVLMSMSRGNGIFKAGVAIAPVTDWRFYDSVYTERFMRTPQQNDSGYKAGSPVNFANKLEGNLLLIHGSADDNVHFQNTMDYAAALVKANKQFDMFVFTDKDHSIRGAANRTYLYEKVIKFLKTNM